MREDPDRAADAFYLPGQKDAISHCRGLNSQQVKKTLRDPQKLGPSSFKANTARTGGTRQNRLQKWGIDSGRRNPLITLFARSVGSFDADPGAVCPTNIDRRCDQ